MSSKETVDFKISARITAVKNKLVQKAVYQNDTIHNKTEFISQAIDFYLDHLNGLSSVEERQSIIIKFLNLIIPDQMRIEFLDELGLYGKT